MAVATVESAVKALEKQLEHAAVTDTDGKDAVSMAIGCLHNVELHPYQKDGLAWLAHRERAHVNVILGDEMGLGKTVQTIAFVCYLNVAYAASFKTCLVVAPLSVLPNWNEQFTRYAPHLSVVTYCGDKNERRDLQTKFHSQASPKILLTSYELVALDTTFLKACAPWSLGVFDEGHRLKNAKSQIHQTLRDDVISERKMILTGTPVQNNLAELAALLSLLNPMAFTPAVCLAFTATQPSPSLLRSILAPVMLLRTVDDVQEAVQLPPLTKVVIHTELSPMQRAYYKQIVSKGTAFESTLSLMNVLAQLRKACNHPYLFPNAEPEPFEEGPHLYMNSGKLFVLHTLLHALHARNHVVLLFSTSTAFLDIIQDYCTWQKLSYERLDGSVRGEERWQAIDRFRHEDAFLFLLSTRAGGVGLNLQRADTVIFCDVDYNPQMELQALARAYRMGQTNAIHVMHLVCAHSVEEIMYKRSLEKLKLSATVRECSKARHALAVDGTPEWRDDMVQYGLQYLMEQSDDDGLQPLTDDQLETILHRGRSTTAMVAPALPTQLVDDENMYYFDGHDYSTTTAADATCLKQLQLDMASTPRLRKTTPSTIEYEHDADDAVDVVDADALAQQRLARKHALWAKNNYTSYAIDATLSELGHASGSNDDDDEACAITYKTGNAALASGDDVRPAIILHCVDTSGEWTSRGFFGAISHRAPYVEAAYRQMKVNHDLKLGQAHCIPLDNHTFVCLLVVQTYLHQKKKRTGKTLAVRLNSLQLALAAVAAKARQCHATIHMPRLGAGTPGFNWYAVERLIKKHLRAVTVYYFTPSTKRHKATHATSDALSATTKSTTGAATSFAPGTT
ncbi:hypothetical protein H310_13103 [Aphanomyces invadans]|uniref:Helicase ATP-binding domain-containing protein n=1 Tax=Aphanomyces invadans TaxID=157072 RepID=A0A024TES2_9STRA|nr:hypothetical protein H310_13103 [Aphanomyces invadans]ETV92660.1 hypothetical protein H310_13103 [Aphanomyces invadans]|eukprot:XP_008878696.1 hypothetical protein H310_13103 [Aphanomyces invadans]